MNQNSTRVNCGSIVVVMPRAHGRMKASTSMAMPSDAMNHIRLVIRDTNEIRGMRSPGLSWRQARSVSSMLARTSQVEITNRTAPM